jgi:hypothetical protein
MEIFLIGEGWRSGRERREREKKFHTLALPAERPK